MALFERNLSDREALIWVFSGFMGLVVGLFIFLNAPIGIVVCIIGLSAFAIGYYSTNPFKGLEVRDWYYAVIFVLLFLTLFTVALVYFR